MTYNYFSIGGVTKGAGSQTIAGATPMTELSVSGPSLGYLNGASNEVWFKFTANADGKILFDTTLSWNLATNTNNPIDPETALTLFQGSDAHSLSDLNFLDYSTTGTDDNSLYVNRGQITSDVTTGTTYYLRIQRLASDFTTAMVLRISDYAIPTDWATLPDQQWVIVPPDGALYNSDKPPPDIYAVDVQSWHIPDYLISGGGFGTLGIGHCQKWDRGFNGYYQMQQSFGGPRPGDATEVAAWQCAWRWAHKGNWIGQWWSLHPRGDSGYVPYSWNGTDPYNPDIPGSGTCVIWSGTINSPDDTNPGTVIISYGSDAGGGFTTAFAHFQSRNPCQRTKVSQMALQAGQAAGGPYPTPPTGLEEAELEWEDDRCTITGLDAAPDENVLPSRHSADNGTVDFRIMWYLKATEYDENPLPVGPGTQRNWGPDRQNDTWVGNTTGPSTLDADLVLPLYGGGDTPWTPISMGIVNQAIAYEEDGAESGLRAIAVNPGQLDDGVPGVIFPDGMPPEYKEAYRNSFVSYRVHLRPSRYRWIPVPALPPVDDTPAVILGALDLTRDRFAP